ncbi:unnamed protein product [Prunus armeniaca]
MHCRAGLGGSGRVWAGLGGARRVWAALGGSRRRKAALGRSGCQGGSGSLGFRVCVPGWV